MIETKKHNIIITDKSHEQIVPVQVKRAMGKRAIDKEKLNKQDHGDRGTNIHESRFYGTPPMILEEEILDAAAEQELQDYLDSGAEQDDFTKWAEELDTDTETEWTTSTPNYHIGIQAEIADLSGDLEKVGKTPEEIAAMSPEELEAFHQWLLKRTK